MLMTPLQIKQQKMSKMMSVVQPELQKIQKKYQGKVDQTSRMKLNEETMLFIRSTAYLLRKLPSSGYSAAFTVCFVSSYLSYSRICYESRGRCFSGLAQRLSQSNMLEALTQFATDNNLAHSFTGTAQQIQNGVTDFLYLLNLLSGAVWRTSALFLISDRRLNRLRRRGQRVNMFAGINISESPWDVIQNGIQTGAWILVIVAILVPVLAWFTQWLNYKLMPQQVSADDRIPCRDL